MVNDAEISRRELEYYRVKYRADYCTGYFMPTLCTLAGVRIPRQAGGIAAEKVMQLASEKEYSALIDEHWKKYNRDLKSTPDHGQHRDDIPEDMIVNHCFRLRAGGKPCGS